MRGPSGRAGRTRNSSAGGSDADAGIALHDASVMHAIAVLVSEIRCRNMDDSTAVEPCYRTRIETAAVRPRESRAVILCGPTARGQWKGSSLDERPASTPSTDQETSPPRT